MRALTTQLFLMIIVVLGGCAEFSATPEFRSGSEGRRGAFMNGSQADGTDLADGDDGVDAFGDGDNADGGGKDGDEDGSLDSGKDIDESDDGDDEEEGELEFDDEETTLQLADPSKISVTSFCSKNGTKHAGTNVFNESQLVLKLYDSTSLAEVEQFDEEGIRDSLIDYKSFEVNFASVDDGEYVMAICAGSNASACNLSSTFLADYRDDPEELEETSAGLLGVVDQIQVREGRASTSGEAMVLMKEEGSNCDVENSPLIINFAAAGLELTPLSKGVEFDIDGKEGTETISWIKTKEAAFLVLDRNGDGQITSVHEMFGNNTVGPDETTAANGFAALAKYDANLDGQISAADEIYGALRLWFDHDGDTVVDAGELETLASRSALSIALNYTDMLERDPYGNATRQRSVVKTDGASEAMIFDVWFRSY